MMFDNENPNYITSLKKSDFLIFPGKTSDGIFISGNHLTAKSQELTAEIKIKAHDYDLKDNPDR